MGEKKQLKANDAVQFVYSREDHEGKPVTEQIQGKFVHFAKKMRNEQGIESFQMVQDESEATHGVISFNKWGMTNQFGIELDQITKIENN